MITLLQEHKLLNPNLTESEIKNINMLDKSFDKMFKELIILQKHLNNNTLHLAEFDLSVSTRKVFNEIRYSNRSLDVSVLYEAVDDNQPMSVGDVSKNILGHINKFHADNKADLDKINADDRLKDVGNLKNIGAEPSILQKIATKTKTLGKKSGELVMKLYESIIIGSLKRFEKWALGLKTDILDAKKQGTAWQMIATKLGPSLKTAKWICYDSQNKPLPADKTPQNPTVEQGCKIEYLNDSEGTGFINWLKSFAQKNPSWTNLIVGLLLNLTKYITATSLVATGAASGTVAAGALAAGVIAGLIIRTLVGRLKGEEWGAAFKKAVIVTGLSLVGGALTKGLFSYFKGDGFIDGAKSYFVGSGVGDQLTSSGAKQIIDTKSEDYADIIKSSNNWNEFARSDVYREMVKNLAKSNSAMSQNASAGIIKHWFSQKDSLTTDQLARTFKGIMGNRFTTLTQGQNVDPTQVFKNLTKSISDTAADTSTIDMSTVSTGKITGLISQLHNTFPNNAPTSDQLLNFFTKKGISVEDAKYLAKTITGGDSASRAERFRDLWRMGQGDTSVLNAVKGLGDLPKNQYDALVGQSGIATNVAGGASTAVLQNINDNSVANAIKALGYNEFAAGLTRSDNSWLLKKFLPVLEKVNNIPPDSTRDPVDIVTILAKQVELGDPRALSSFTTALKASGGIPIEVAQDNLDPDQIRLLGPLVAGSTVKESSYKTMMKNIYL